MIGHVISTLRYVKSFAGETILIKLGGAALQDAALIRALCEDLALIRSVGVSLVLVHGGGPSINEELRLHGIEWHFVEGQRVTTPEMMSIVEMVLCGAVNRRVVRTLNAAGVRALGMSGSDARMLQCSQMGPELGQVGQIDEVDPTYLRLVLDSQREPGQGCVPVIAPTGYGEGGEAFNINADWAAVRIAEALGIRKVIFLTDQHGILDGEQKLIPELDAGELQGLIETGVVQGGMLAKARTMIHALSHGVTDIHVLNSRRSRCLVEELFTDTGVGTLCRARSRTGQKV
jgi:acetylglutamate kinase